MFKLPKLFPDLDTDTQLSLVIISLFAGGIILYLSIVGLAGRFGSLIGAFLEVLMGRAAIVFPLAFFLAAIITIRIQKNPAYREEINGRVAWGIGFIIMAFCGFLSLIFRVENTQQMLSGGGLIGYIVYPFVLGFFGIIGGFILIVLLAFFGFFLISGMKFDKFTQTIQNTFKDPEKFFDLIPDVFELWKNSKKEDDVNEKYSSLKPQIIEEEYTISDSKMIVAEEEQMADEEYDNVINKIPSDGLFDQDDKEKINRQTRTYRRRWQLPPVELLREFHGTKDPGDLESNKKTIQETFEHFNIKVEMDDTVVGPTVTQYTLKPANGVRLATIEGHIRDLALALAVPSIRIEAPVGGKSLVGIEIPNRSKSQVRLRDIVETKFFQKYDGDLPLAIGQDVGGKNIIYSLAKMPHLLVAGATGAGKSVWINGMLLSLLYKYSPFELQLVLVDMKRVELKLYEGIPHLLSDVITEADKAINALKWTVLEMDRRYKLLEEYGKRNIKDYNRHASENKIEKLPYIVFVIDELGDLMMLAKAEVEPIIVRLTQMSRAVGIHLVLGTQRPDTHVVTGLIKANVPTRIAFAVASQIDSRVILDNGGAEKLLGQGDGLIMTPSSIKPIRFQGPNVEEAEVKQCISYLKEQSDATNISNRNHEVTEKPKVKIVVPGLSDGQDKDEEKQDDVFEEAKRLVIQYQKASTSFLQQMMGIGYPRAAKIINRLEEMGIIGPQNGSKPRDVYMLPNDDD